MQKKSLKIIIGSLEVGGAEQHVVKIAPYFVKNGFKTSILSLSSNTALKSKLTNTGVNLKTNISCKNNAIPKKLKKMINFFLMLGFLIYDMLIDRKSIRHTFLPMAYIMTCLAAKITLLKAPIIMSRRSLNTYKQTSKFFIFIEKLFQNKIDLALANSKAVYDELIEEGFENKKVGLIYNGIETNNVLDINFDNYQNYKNQAKKTLNISIDEVALVIIANLIPYKGHMDLLQALAIARYKFNKQWKLYIIGQDRGIQNQLEQFCQKFNLSENVVFKGLQHNVSEWQKACDIGVLCSHEEGFSNAILEGMLNGLCMIATDVGGNKEAVIDLKTGLIVPKQDPVFLSQALVTLFLNEDMRKELAINAQQRIKKHFNMEKCINEYVLVYNNLI